jgi:glutamate racemase
LLGLFDSGSGGLNTVRYVKELADDVDLLYLIDRENAPYGIKTEQELIDITKRNIDRLTDMGAWRVLIACCTASTVYPMLGEKYGKIAIPIVDAIANMAEKSTRIGRIGVIATDRTVRSHAFKNALKGCEVVELALPSLVGLIDGGLNDGCTDGKTERMLEEMMRPVLEAKIDTLILGCTHFPALIKTVSAIASRYGVDSVVDSARVGAELLIEASRNMQTSEVHSKMNR